jgi:hypothetical protein
MIATTLFAMLAPAAAASDDPIPNQAALALAPTVGWLMLLAFALIVAIFIIHRDTWRRIFLRAEDPRSIAAFRIAFGLMTLANINGLWELFHYLFTDEGLFFADVAQEVFAKEQFDGFADGIGDEPYGFLGWAGFVEFIKGPKFSLLFFWDTPTAFWLHLVAFWLACGSLIVGFKTKYTKWLTFLLFNSIVLRNQVFWEGTENVYRCFLFYLCISSCGAAYSVDNWLRCRKLRKQGLLSEPGGPGDGAGLAPSPEYPKGLAAIYQRVPAWPRMLMILQVAALYCSTGTVKNGHVWQNGDAFYYALNLDHFYRFEPQQLSALFGTNLFRINTWVVHWWEACFPLVVLGLVSRYMRRERIPAPPRAQLWLARACWVALGLTACAIVQIVLPVHIPRVVPPGKWTLADWQLYFPWIWIGGMLAIVGFIALSHRRPPSLTIRGHRHVLDLDWVCTWLFGRRVWLSPRRHLPRPPHRHDEHRLVHPGHPLHLLRLPQRPRARRPAAAPARPRQAGDPHRGPHPPAAPPRRRRHARLGPLRRPRPRGRRRVPRDPERGRRRQRRRHPAPRRALGRHRRRRVRRPRASSATSPPAAAAWSSSRCTTRTAPRGSPGPTPRWAASSPARCVPTTSPAWRSGCSPTRTASAAPTRRPRGASRPRTPSSGGSASPRPIRAGRCSPPTRRAATS